MAAALPTPSRRAAWIRGGLIALAVPNTINGAWLLLGPASFYRDFPGFGRAWVASFPPYNDHLLTDFGGGLLGLAAVLWIAAVVLSRPLVRTALAAVIVQGVAHFAWHLSHTGALPLADELANSLALAFGPGLALILLVLTRSLEPAEHATVNPAGSSPERRAEA